MTSVHRGLGLASVVVGGVLAALGALNWYYALFWSPGNSWCSGHTCYAVIAEPVPWYYLAFLPVGLVLLSLGIVLLVRRGNVRPAK